MHRKHFLQFSTFRLVGQTWVCVATLCVCVCLSAVCVFVCVVHVGGGALLCGFGATNCGALTNYSIGHQFGASDSHSIHH